MDTMKATRSLIVQLRKSGMTYDAIAKQLGCSKPKARHHAVRAYKKGEATAADIGYARENSVRNKLTPEQLRVLRHMLGIDKPWEDNPKPYRDYYCANPGDPTMVELARVGAVRLYSTQGEYEWYTCTPEGRAAAIESHRYNRYSPSRRRYIRFLDIKDCHPDLTFRQFLTDPRYRSARTSGAPHE